MSTIIVPQLTLSDFTITLDDVHKLAFDETLKMIDLKGETVDEITVAVEVAGDRLMVYQYSQNDDHLLRIESTLLLSLHTHCEMRRIRRPSSWTRTMTITGREASYNVFATSKECDESWREKMEINNSPSDPVLMEGANIVLLRKIAISRLFGQFKTRIMNHEMELCECLYNIEHPTDYGEVIVRRTLKTPRGVETMTTVLSPEGRIISHRWSVSSFCLIGHTDFREVEEATVQEEQQEVGTEGPLKADQTAYFQRKEEVSQKLKQYLLDHADIQDLIADFLKNVLFEEPEDVLDFADNFFSEFMSADRLRGDQQQTENADFFQKSRDGDDK